MKPAVRDPWRTFGVAQTRSRAWGRSILRIGSAGRTLVVLFLAVASLATARCAGDCDGNGSVSVGELIKGVRMAFGESAGACAAMEANSAGCTTIAGYIAALSGALIGCSHSPIPSPTPTVGLGFQIAGCVNEFPGVPCGAFLETVRLEPLGLTSALDVDQRFQFDAIAPGDYVLTVVGGCNPFGCWEEIPIAVIDRDLFVVIDLIPYPTPTATPSEVASTLTPVPTATPSPTEGESFRIAGCVNEFPGVPCGAFLETVRLEPLGLTSALDFDQRFQFDDIAPGDYVLTVAAGCNLFGMRVAEAVTESARRL